MYHAFGKRPERPRRYIAMIAQVCKSYQECQCITPLGNALKDPAGTSQWYLWKLVHTQWCLTTWYWPTSILAYHTHNKRQNAQAHNPNCLTETTGINRTFIYHHNVVSTFQHNIAVRNDVFNSV